MNKEAISVGIVGFGTVGTGTVKILLNKTRDLEKKLGFPVVLRRIADIDIKRNRGVKLPKRMLINNYQAISGK